MQLLVPGRQSAGCWPTRRPTIILEMRFSYTEYAVVSLPVTSLLDAL